MSDEKEVQEKEDLVEKAKGLGIKSPHFMGLDTLKLKIAEAIDKIGGAGSNGDDNTSGDINLSELVKDGVGWLYHETEQPRIFEDGEEIPEGWNLDNRVNWVFPDTGKPINVNS
jgi:chromosome condensin MukBEF MukE localization factor